MVDLVRIALYRSLAQRCGNKAHINIIQHSLITLHPLPAENIEWFLENPEERIRTSWHKLNLCFWGVRTEIEVCPTIHYLHRNEKGVWKRKELICTPDQCLGERWPALVFTSG